MSVTKPQFENKWNHNTIISTAGFAIMIIGGFIAWGYVVAEFRGGLLNQRVDIEQLDKRMSQVEASVRMLDGYEIRLATVEKQASDAAVYMRSMEATLSSMVADIRVIREILARVETSNGNRRLQPDRP